MSTDLATFECELGHTWDGWGEWGDLASGDRTFIPETLQLCTCPTCDQVVRKISEPERLA